MTHPPAHPGGGPDPLPDDTNRLLACLRTAADYFADRLAGSWVPDYLTRRGLGAAANPAQPWGTGYAPAGWTTLVHHLRTRGWDDGTLEATGLASRSSRGTLIDRFRDRLVLPVREPGGAVVGFIGRARPSAEASGRVPRYLNSPQTALYRKGELLYGLAENVASLRAGAVPVLVEGALDAIAVTTATGGRCAGLAPSGTALTPRQAARLGAALPPGGPRLVVAFDPDDAGRAAAASAYDLLRGAVPPPLAAGLPPGRDPANLLAAGGPAALTAALTDPARVRPLADVAVDVRLDSWGSRLDDLPGAVSALRSVAPLVAALPPGDAARQLERLTTRLNLAPDTVIREVLAAIAAAPPTPAPGRSGTAVPLPLPTRRPTTSPLHAGPRPTTTDPVARGPGPPRPGAVPRPRR